MKRLFILCFLLSYMKGYTQHAGNLQPVESYLLEVISKDTVSSTTIYLPEILDFGIQWKGHSHLILVKEKKLNYILLAGTHRVYQINLGDSLHPLTRIDSSDYFGDNYNCMAFIHRDTLFEYGGYGFWKNRDFFTRFIPASGDWEFVQGGDALENAAVFSYLDKGSNKFYCLGSYQQNSFNNFTPYLTDSVYEHDLDSKRWHILGRINSEFLRNYNDEVKGITWVTPYGLGISIPNNFCIIDFKGNSVIPVKKSMGDSLNAVRTNTASKNQNPISLWFYLKDSLYHVSLGKEYSVKKIKLDSSSLDFTSAVPLFTPQKKETIFFSFSGNRMIHTFYWVLIAGLAAVVYKLFLGRKSTPQQPTVFSPEISTGNVNDFRTNIMKFIDQLTPVEKSIVKELVQYSLQQKMMNVSIINKTLGVSAKDPEIQKARRSVIITNINNLYTQHVHVSGALICRKRDEFDKRAWLYFIEEDKSTTLSPYL